MILRRKRNKSMGDTEVMKAPRFKTEPDIADSEVIQFNDEPESSQPAANTEPSQSVSVIGESLHFKGELSAGEDLIIDGKVEGTINQGKCCLTLRQKGIIIAQVNATKIFIEGTVEGDLQATVSVTVRKTGTVTGNIVAPKICIEEGATFNGSITMQSPARSRK